MKKKLKREQKRRIKNTPHEGGICLVQSFEVARYLPLGGATGLSGVEPESIA